MTYKITYDEDSNGNVILRYRGDAQALVDACAAEARSNREDGPKPIADNRANFRKMLSLGPMEMMTICHEKGIPYHDLDAIFKAARNRDYAKFRCIDDARYFGRRGK